MSGTPLNSPPQEAAKLAIPRSSGAARARPAPPKRIAHDGRNRQP